MNEIAAAIGSLKAALDISKSFLSLRDEATIQQKVIELQGTIIQAQQSAFAAQQERAEFLETARTLEAEVARLKNWNDEKKNYDLVAPREGVPLYRLKVSDSRIPHYLCSHCFENGSKAMIIRTPHIRDYFFVHRCPKCSTEYQFEEYESPELMVYTSDYDPYEGF